MWQRAIEAWTAHLAASAFPATTINLRVYQLTRASREIRLALDKVSTDDLTAWLASHDWAPNTRRSYRTTLRSFFRWAVASGRVTESPAELLPPVRVPRGKPRPAPERAYQAALLDADERARLAIQLAGACGLRRGEIARVRREHVEIVATGYSLRVIGKGGHVRMVPLPDYLARELLARPDGWVFQSSHGGHLTPHHLGKLVRRHLPDDLTTHTLRHRCASIAYAATRDIRAVQELLGHASIETTQLYTATPDDSVRRAMLAAAA